MSATVNHGGLQLISTLFSYPGGPVYTPMPPELQGDSETALLAERGDLAPIILENEYVRLFVNAMPELPCAPYGSVYLEGTLLGGSTQKVAAIYRKYGIESNEPADHIAVESEFLAWLHGRAADDVDARKDFEYLLGHLRQWSEPFFKTVEEHDRLGYFRRSAELARKILAGSL